MQRIIKTGRVEDKATFDFVLMNSKGETILSAEGFEALVLEGTGVVTSMTFASKTHLSQMLPAEAYTSCMISLVGRVQLFFRDAWHCVAQTQRCE